jgi:hypothetical protein
MYSMMSTAPATSFSIRAPATFSSASSEMTCTSEGHCATTAYPTTYGRATKQAAYSSGSTYGGLEDSQEDAPSPKELFGHSHTMSECNYDMSLDVQSADLPSAINSTAPENEFNQAFYFYVRP